MSVLNSVPPLQQFFYYSIQTRVHSATKLAIFVINSIFYSVVLLLLLFTNVPPPTLLFFTSLLLLYFKLTAPVLLFTDKISDSKTKQLLLFVFSNVTREAPLLLLFTRVPQLQQFFDDPTQTIVLSVIEPATFVIFNTIYSVVLWLLLFTNVLSLISLLLTSLLTIYFNPGCCISPLLLFTKIPTNLIHMYSITLVFFWILIVVYYTK